MTIFKTIPSSRSGACPVPTRNNFKKKHRARLWTCLQTEANFWGQCGVEELHPPGARQKGAEQPSAFWPNSAFIFFKQFILCSRSISNLFAHLRIQHCNRIQDSFPKWGWRRVRCGSNPYRELPEQTPNPAVPRAAQSTGTEPPLGPHCSTPR